MTFMEWLQNADPGEVKQVMFGVVFGAVLVANLLSKVIALAWKRP